MPCPCQEAKKARLRIERSGLQHVLNVLTFDRYKVAEPWQERALATTLAWLTVIGDNADVEGNGIKPWLFMGGAVGSGKTHLCTAACGELLQSGRAVRYMLWPEEARKLKACVNDGEEFERIIHPLEHANVLYIDDLFKVQRSPGMTAAVTPAEIRVAFELLDARYRINLPTIISCEWLMDELLQMDEGVFSRVYERTKRFAVQIGRVAGRNMRLTDIGGVM